MPDITTHPANTVDINITVRTTDGDQEYVTLSTNDELSVVKTKIAAAFATVVPGATGMDITEVVYGGRSLQREDTPESFSMQDEAVVFVSFDTSEAAVSRRDWAQGIHGTITSVLKDICALNRGVNVDKLLGGITFGTGNQNSLSEWDLSQNQLTALPPSFCNLRISGSLNLGHNRLQSLPSDFGQIVIGDQLILSHNHLSALPPSFEEIQVGNKIHLDNNNLQAYFELREDAIPEMWILVSEEDVLQRQRQERQEHHERHLRQLRKEQNNEYMQSQRHSQRSEMYKWLKKAVH